jgi:hypothetical protein
VRAPHAVAAAVMAAATFAGGVLVDGALAQSPPAVNTLNDLWAALERCWVPPPLDQSRPGMQITVLVSFKRNGEVLGEPRITFQSAGATDDDRVSYRAAVAEMLKRCSPLPFTEAFGNARAGQPVTVRFIDNRKLKDSGTTYDR